MWQDFKKFALKGNVVDMAVGVIVGGAFGKIVTSLVNDVIMPILGLLVGRIDLSSLKLVLRQGSDTAAELSLTYGAFLQNVLDFLIISFSIFMAIRMINKLRKTEEEAPPAPAAPPEPSAEEKLLSEIRDLLKEQVGERSA
ncbi:MAG: large-conductance mechanosensitive channel protein MscL [Limnochordia bacterium]|jgi:large conductance mechanosensitive channel|nr:large-conductance mechanosensitive channel protein MscL [Bacillota bacterium]NLL08493.1 large-conductance mechanosensitive channel protein MscL [Bacillota bacterium]HBG08571.1 large conductance mechanosensitive channel protein MscL [Bacillota bacterium]